MNSYGKRISLVGSAVLTVAAVLGGVWQDGAEAGTLVVGGDQYVQRYNLDGSGGATIFSNGYGTIQAVAFDPLADEIYFHDVQGWYHHLRRYNVSNATTDIVSEYYDNKFHPQSMDVDPLRRVAVTHYEHTLSVENAKVWIWRRNVDTNAAGTVYIDDAKVFVGWSSSYIPRKIYAYPHDLTDVAVDPLGGKVYWADKNAKTISRKSIDGTGGVELLYSNLANPHSVALDVGVGALYWSDAGDSSNAPVIRRGPIDGGIITDLVTSFTGTRKPLSIDVDPSAGHKWR